MEGADVNRNQSEGNLELLCMAPLRGTHTLWFLVVCNTFLAVGAFAGNAVILAALYKESSIHLPSKILLGTLALTDFCVGLILEPLFVTFLLTIEFGGGRSLCHHVITITYITGLFLSSVSLSTLTQISVDRLLALTLGLRYRQLVTARQVLMIVICIWTVSIVFASSVIWNVDITLRYGFIGTVLAVTVSTCCYTTIYQKLRNHRVKIQGHHQRQSNRKEPLNIARYKRTLTNAMWVHFTLVTCYLPFSIVLALINTEGTTPSLAIAWTFVATTVKLNSSINPLLYCWKISEVRRAVIETVQQISCLSA